MPSISNGKTERPVEFENPPVEAEDFQEIYRSFEEFREDAFN
jgi:protein-tyrosine phosphatase